MELIDKYLRATYDNVHIANGVSTVLRCLDDYAHDKNQNTLIFAAYITRLAILDTFEASGYHATYICYSNINGKLTQITWLQANLLTYGKICELIESSNSDLKDFIESILDRADAFDMVDKLIPEKDKEPFIGQSNMV